MPKKFIRCVRKVKKSERKRYGFEKYNPYAVCRKSTGYFGTTHGIGLLHPKHHSKHIRTHKKSHFRRELMKRRFI